MADLEAIRLGLAAALRTALPADQGHVSPYFSDVVTTPALQVVGLDEGEYYTMGFAGGGDSLFFIIEAIVGRVVDRVAQTWLDRFVSAEGAYSLKAALEADKTLTSRLLDDGTVQTGQAAAAQFVILRRYRGQARIKQENGQDVLVGSWIVEVAA